jgi:hypothetical protein
MGIQAISSGTSIDLSIYTQLSTNNNSKSSGGTGGMPQAGASQAAASGTDNSTDTSKIYDKRDTNQDGTVSSLEALQYVIKHPGEETDQKGSDLINKSQSEATYNQQGNASNNTVGLQSTFSISA